MKVLREGKAHKAMAWFTTCDCCESELRIIEGDPLATPKVCYNGDRHQYWIKYICPVCGAYGIAKTENVAFNMNDANAERKEIVLNKEDREEIESWRSQGEISMDDLEWITDRSAP